MTHLNDRDLETALKTVFEERCPGTRLTITRRENLLHGTHPKEVLTCALDGGETEQILVKYQTVGTHTAHGHRAGLERERAAYGLLYTLGAEVPELLGVVEGPAGNIRALLISYLPEAVRITKSLDSHASHRAAAWIAKLHKSTEGLKGKGRDWLPLYDRNYFLEWSERTLHYASASGMKDKWLEQSVEIYAEHLDDLLQMPDSLLHGEFYPDNLLYADGQVYPVDWESAAFGPGLVDLAMFSEGWSDEDQSVFVEIYASIFPTHSLENALRVARLYVQFRWLGDRVEWFQAPGGQDRLRNLKSLTQKLTRV